MSSPSASDQPVEPTPDPAAATIPPSGWYADPAGEARLRYWDGGAWTEHTSAPVAAPVQGAVPAYAGPSYGYGGYAVAPRSVNFGEAVRSAFHGWQDYASRSTRSEYWWFYLFQTLVGFVANAVLLVAGLAITAALAPSTGASGSTGSSGGSTAAVAIGVVVGVLLLAYLVVLFLVSLPLTVRRLHDTSRSGWWYLITLVPFGGFVLIYFLAMETTPGPNEYGPFPT